ncbi:MAG TPA: hypothetical protein VGN85_02695, partial [Methyloceanibacter sp.]|nr:hypothetical protein [Methyloceanibacter sp.]
LLQHVEVLFQFGDVKFAKYDGRTVPRLAKPTIGDQIYRIQSPDRPQTEKGQSHGYGALVVGGEAIHLKSRMQ